MTRARIETITADPATAAKLVGQAELHLSSARSLDGDAQAAYGLCWQAALKALTAALLTRGERVTSGAGGHVIALREGAAALAVPADLTRRLDHMRRTRHRAFYDADDVSELELEGALADADAAVAAAAETVGRR